MPRRATAKPPSASGKPTRPEPDYVINVVGQTDVGKVRERNEDSMAMVDLTTGQRGDALDAEGPGGVFLTVCDGLGGSAGGNVASEIAARTLVENVVARQGELTGPEVAASVVRAAVLEANRAIFRQAQKRPELDGMGTTVTAALIRENWLVFAQVGDSRAYLLRAGQLVQLTRDQSLVVALLELGILSPSQAQTLQGANVLLQAVGTEEAVEVVTCRFGLRQGDMVLLCSDGLTAAVTDDDIRAILRDGKKRKTTAERLVERAHEGGAPDNITVVIAQVSGSELTAPADEKIIPEVVR